MFERSHLLRWLPIALALVSWLPRRAPGDETLVSQISGILEANCLRCHNPNNSKGDVSLADGRSFATAGLIEPGKADASSLVEVISRDGEAAPRMPKEGAPLTSEQVELVRRWIDEGAEWPEGLVLHEPSRADANWWAFQPLDSSLPATESPAASAIDLFLLQKLEQHELQFSAPADAATLARRLKYALTGLPPKSHELAAFANDRRPDAYERLVDRWLASPRFGEQWGRHWLDVVRFGESNGYERNVVIENLWPFRDYVIDAWNRDKPFNQFALEHLAGDAVSEQEPDAAIGTAFLVSGPYDDVGNQDPQQAAMIRANTIDEMIRATSETFLGLTVGCARCHDHKFDPIPQTDYYAMYATFSGVRHGSRVLATPQQQEDRSRLLAPLEARAKETRDAQQQVENAIVARAETKAAEYQAAWSRPAVDRYGTTEHFAPQQAKFVRLEALNRQDSPDTWQGFRLDEFEVWSAGQGDAPPRNVALASAGARAAGGSRIAEDFQDAYGAGLVIDGHFGERWIASAPELVIELAESTTIDRVYFSSDRTQALPQDSGITLFVGDYAISVSSDGQSWQRVAGTSDRQPPSPAHRRARLLELETTAAEKLSLVDYRASLASTNREIAQIPNYPSVWVGEMSAAAGPFQVFLGGDPQRPGVEVALSSPAALAASPAAYQLPASAPERERRLALARWLVDDRNTLPVRVLANRLWQWSFGAGIVDTPSDFGYLGQLPSHARLLDWLAQDLIEGGWSGKRLIRKMVLSDAFRQSSQWNQTAAGVDAEARWLWRFPPRRLTAEEIRDTVLDISSSLKHAGGGPGFRLYRYLQDNVSTYVPLDSHGPETWRRSVYHQNVRAQLIDVMSDFDCPDPASAAPKRAATTTPLQALTLLNHGFTLEMSAALAAELDRNSSDDRQRVHTAYEIAYGRAPHTEELDAAQAFIQQHGLNAFCRALLNSSELIYVN